MSVAYTLTKNVQEQALTSLKEWISIPSVLNETSSKWPFGDEIQRMLELTLRPCEELGMTTYMDPEGYYGYAEIGEGTETMAILCHIDVVPAEDEAAWKFGPFTATIDEGKIYGRGTQDDKGPTIASLYAVKALVDAGEVFNKKIRFIFGTDEENLWRCMDKYNEKEPEATYGFAPDSDFPLTYAEKGLLQVKLHGPGSKDFQTHNDGAFNVVPDKAVYNEKEKVAEMKALADARGYSYLDQADELVLTGVSVHAKDAQDGVNAVVNLADLLKEHYEHEALAFIADNFVNDPHAKQIFGEVADADSGALTANIAKLLVTPDESVVAIDLRLPVTADKEALVADLKAAATTYGLEYEEYDYLRSLYVPLDHSLIQTLLEVYRGLTGDNSEPISSGGATYARTMNNCVAFGARTVDVPMTAHQVNENMPVKNFYEAMEIYAHAIKALTCD